MEKKILLAMASLLLLTACATQQGVITPYGDSRYEITSTASEKDQSVTKALNTAEYACLKREDVEKGYVVEEKEVEYQGAVPEEERQKVKLARNVFMIFGGFFVPVEGDEDYETTLTVRCE